MLCMARKRKRSFDEHRISNGSSFAECPACRIKVISRLMNTHLDWDCKVLNAVTGKTGISGGFLETKAINSAEIQVDRYEKFQNTSSDVNESDDPARDSSVVCPRLELGDVDKQYGPFMAKDAEENVVYDLHQSRIKEQNMLALVSRGSDVKSDTRHCFSTTISKVELSDEFHAHETIEVHDQCHLLSSNLQTDLTPVPFEEKFDILVGSAQEHETSKTLPDCTDLQLTDNGGTSKIVIDLPGVTQNVNVEGKRNLNVSHNSLRHAWSFITASEPLRAPKGNYVLEDFISEEEERLLISFLDMDLKNPWRLSSFSGLNMTKCYGIRMDLRKRCVQPEIFKIPGIVLPILERLRAGVPCLKDFWPNETNAIDYCKHNGHWLRPHVDDRQLSGTVIVNFSLCGDCKMTYAREKGPQESFKVLLKRRCVQIQTGECRYNFTHSIFNDDLLSPRRVSMTFRQSILP